MLALLLPMVSYFIVKRYSESAVTMPLHYFSDSVIVKTKNGKQYTDTVWHTLKDFSLTNQLGKTVSWKDMSGKIVIASRSRIAGRTNRIGMRLRRLLRVAV